MTRGGMAFDDTGLSWSEPAGKPTCMDCQVDNILNDKVLCMSSCYETRLQFAYCMGQQGPTVPGLEFEGCWIPTVG